MTVQRAAPTTRSKAVCLAGLLAAFLFFFCSGLEAREQQPPPKPAQAEPAQPQSAPAQEAEAPERLHLLVGRSLVISSPTRIKRLSIAEPNIADAIMISPTQVLLNGKTPGGVSLVLWNEADQSQTFDVFVDMDILGLSLKIKEVFPQEPVQVEATKDVIVLSGHISSKAIADRILQIVSAAAPKVISLMDFPTAPTTGEILLAVKFAEVDRTALSQFGVNFISPGTGSGPRATVGAVGTQQFGPPHLTSLTSNPTSGSTTAITTDFTLSDLLNVFVFRPDIDLAITIKALQQKNLLQILAEPNLLTQTDKEASFLAGGEFPFPVVQGGTNFTSVTIQFKEFGVRLNFKPTLTETGRIHLKVRPEVSALDFSNALTISGFTVPALSTRRVETEMELQDGQSFAIAGLVDNRLTKIASKVPGLGDIPILGYLFRSTSFNNSKTELLVVVTPHIVKPLNADQVPAGPQFPKPFLPPAAPEESKKPLAKP
jgi:pilus assembly protein CpaC